MWEKLHGKWFGTLFFCILNFLEFGHVYVYADSYRDGLVQPSLLLLLL